MGERGGHEAPKLLWGRSLTHSRYGGYVLPPREAPGRRVWESGNKAPGAPVVRPGLEPQLPSPSRTASLASPGPMHPGPWRAGAVTGPGPPGKLLGSLLRLPCLPERLSGHSPTHEIAENVEAVQVGVLAAPVHVAAGDRLAQLVWVGEYGQHIICRVGGSRGEWKGSASPTPKQIVRVLTASRCREEQGATQENWGGGEWEEGGQVLGGVWGTRGEALAHIPWGGSGIKVSPKAVSLSLGQAQEGE